MPATTKTIKDGNAASFTSRAWDDGTAISAVTILGDGAGAELAKAEDTAATSGDKGLIPLAVRRDTLAASGADGDYVTINSDGGGRLVTAVGIGTKQAFVEEDAAHTTADLGVMALGVRRSAPAVGAGLDGDYATLNLDDNGWLRTTLGTGTKSAIFLESDAHTAQDGMVVVAAVRRDTPAVGSNADGDYSTINVDDSGRVYVNVDGNTSHDAVDAGRPVLLGARAKAHGSMSAVAADDRTRLHANRHGILWTIGGHPNVITRSARIEDADGAQTNASISGAVASGEKLVITRLSVFADASNSGDVYCKIGFGAATIPASTEAGANSILFEGQLPAGGGITMGDGSGVLAVGADDEELRLTCDDPAAGALNVSFARYVIES
jgi:hypothetical protein